MSTPPAPPGWYPDPGAAHTERWWDGTAWTAQVRRTGGEPELPDPVEAAYGTGFGPPGSGDTPPGTGRRPVRGRVVAVTLVGAVLAAAIVTGVAALGTGDDPEIRVTDPGAGPGATHPPTSTPAPTPSPSASGDPHLLVDELNNISVPVPAGWKKAEDVHGLPTMVTEKRYPCPGATAYCDQGRVSTTTAREDSAGDNSPRAAAEADIEDTAARAYDRDGAGGRPFDGMTGHRRIAAGPVEVAGRQGWFVRWRVSTRTGPGGWVQSLAFPAPTDAGAVAVVRYTLDTGPGTPPVSLMDTVTRGIRPLAQGR